MNTNKKIDCHNCGIVDYESHMTPVGKKWYCNYCNTGRKRNRHLVVGIFTVLVLLTVLGFARQCHADVLTPIITYSHIDTVQLKQFDFVRSTDPNVWIGYETARDSTGKKIGVFPIIVSLWPHYDVSCNGKVNVTDLTILVNYMFRGKIY